jgi:hypothetical protein
MSTDTLHADGQTSAEISPEQAPAGARLGSFQVTSVVRIEAHSPRRVLLAVSGAEDTRFAAISALATASPAPATPDATAEIEVRLAKLRHFSHPGLAPVLEAGIAGTVVYVIHQLPDGQQLLADHLEKWEISAVRDAISSLAGVLQIAHELGLAHGTIGMDTIYRRADGKMVLLGLGVASTDPAADQKGLAIVAAELLAGRRWVDSANPIAENGHSQLSREFLSDYTERVANVLIRASGADPTERFGSIKEFAETLATAIKFSAEDLVHGAFEAISAQSPDLAKLIAEKAAAYDPQSEGLALLRLQLKGDSPFAAAELTPAFAPPELVSAPLPAVSPSSQVPHGEEPDTDLALVRSSLPEELTQGLPDEFLRALAPQFHAPQARSRQKVSPIFVLILGGVGIAFLIAAAGLGTFLLSGR